MSQVESPLAVTGVFDVDKERTEDAIVFAKDDVKSMEVVVAKHNRRLWQIFTEIKESYVQYKVRIKYHFESYRSLSISL